MHNNYFGSDEVLLKYNKQSIGVGTFIKNVCGKQCDAYLRVVSLSL